MDGTCEILVNMLYNRDSDLRYVGGGPLIPSFGIHT